MLSRNILKLYVAKQEISGILVSSVTVKELFSTIKLDVASRFPEYHSSVFSNKKNRLIASVLLPCLHSWLQYLSVKNQGYQFAAFEVGQRVLLERHMVPILPLPSPFRLLHDRCLSKTTYESYPAA